MWKYLKRKLVQFLTKHLLKALTSDDVLTITNKGWFLRKRRLSDEEVAQLRTEARDFQGSVLWELMRSDIEWAAFIRGRKAIKDEDNLMCHAMFYNLDLIEQYLQNCKKL